MAKVSRRDGQKEKFWRQLLRRWRQSGLGVREFCACEGVSEPSFYAWRRQLAERDEQVGQARRQGQGEAAGRESARAPANPEAAGPERKRPMFAPVHVQQRADQSDQSDQSETNGARHESARDIEVVLPDGIRLRLTAQFDAAALQRVLGVLSGLNGATINSPVQPPVQSPVQNGGESC